MAMKKTTEINYKIPVSFEHVPLVEHLFFMQNNEHNSDYKNKKGTNF